MEEYKIVNDNGTNTKWSSINNNDYYCLLYNDSNQKYTFTPSTDLNCQLFMIGGGGAGGYFFGGGGGAGAAYTNNNYTFSKDNTYTFTIGTGGTCSIDNISNLFNNGLTLKVFNVTQQTPPNLNNFQIVNDDYSTINVPAYTSFSTYIVNDIKLNADLLHPNTLYVWDGYIKSSISGNINFTIESNLKTFVWIDKYIFNDTNTFISSYNIKDVKTIEMKADVFYKIKIIVYADSNITTSGFNLKCDNCTFYNFNSANEIYNYTKATETLITAKDKNNTIVNNLRCIGGGNGGCGLVNQNTDLDGGCGGGSGLNKINGKSLAQSSYNGFDGAIGSYLGGGGGIAGSGVDNAGGDGVVLSWFDSNFIFGAGGNGAGNLAQQNLGYGSGGNGYKCCYSNNQTDNNGMNGCVLIYIKSPITVEQFTNLNTNIIIPTTTILYNLQNASIASLYNYSFIRQFNDYRNSNNFPFAALSSNINGAEVAVNDNLLQEMYLYDLFTITNIYASAYNLFLNRINVIYASSSTTAIESKFQNLKISIPTSFDGLTTCTEYDVDGNGTSGIQLQLGFLNSPQYNSNIANYINSITGNSAQTGINNDYVKDLIYKNFWYNSKTPIIQFAADSGNQQDVFTNLVGTVIPNTQDTYIKNAAFPLYYAYSGASSSTSLQNISGIKNLFNYINTPSANLISSSATDITKFALPVDYLKMGFSNSVIGSTSNFGGLVALNSPTPYRYTGTLTNGSTYTSTFMGYRDCSAITNQDVVNAYNIDYNAYVNPSNQSVLNNYRIQRVFLYHKAFFDITNVDNTVKLLQLLKYSVYYNNLMFYTNIIHYNFFNYIESNPKAAFTTAGLITSITDSAFTNDINYIKNNLDVYSTSLVSAGDITNSINNFTQISAQIENDRNTYITSQNDLNKLTYRYNMYLSSYNNILLNFKIFIIIAILLLISIIAIYMSSEQYIDLNSKISIYTVIIIFVIIASYFYYNYTVVENFGTLYSTYSTGGTQGLYQLNTTNILSPLAGYIQSANNFIVKILSNASTNNISYVTDEMNGYINNYVNDRSNKIYSYKKKYDLLSNSINLLIKNINFYKAIMMLTSFIIILLLILMILYLLFPQFLTAIVILILIPLLISVFITVYYLTRSTRMNDNKKYWANMNPSDEVLKTLN
jgi:hypothetical protein